MNKSYDMINMAVAALNRNIEPLYVVADLSDDACYLTIMGKRFMCIVVPNLTASEIVEERHEATNEKPVIYITRGASEKLLDFCARGGINILDCAGNFNIQNLKDDGNVIFKLTNRGEKPLDHLVKDVNAYPIFMKSGLKVIYYFLLKKGNISKSYREIREATGVSIGTVKNVIEGMIYNQFARVEGKKRILINVERLVSMWATNYSIILKPKLLVAKMDFKNKEEQEKWQSIQLPEGMFWGGETAAALTDGFLSPGEFTIYTDVSASLLMRSGAVVPDTSGVISIYQKFWNDDTDGKTVPAILTYADLIVSGNSRCIEAAQKLKYDELGYLF